MARLSLLCMLVVSALCLAGCDDDDCENGSCICERGESCELECDAPPCHVVCEGDNPECSATCGNGDCACGVDSDCDFDCHSPPCHVDCAPDSNCSGVCANGDCDCEPGASC